MFDELKVVHGTDMALTAFKMMVSGGSEGVGSGEASAAAVVCHSVSHTHTPLCSAFASAVLFSLSAAVVTGAA